MADSSKNNRKRKKHLITPQPPQKKHHTDTTTTNNSNKQKKEEEFDYTIEAAHPWRNLHLILSLQNKQIDLLKKVELAFNYVNSRTEELSNRIEQQKQQVDDDCETVNLSRLVVFLNDWVQSLLISTDKKLESGVVVQACLDFRCWVIFKFCLEQSLRLHVSLSFSRNLLRAFSSISRNALSSLERAALDDKVSVFNGEGFELYSVVVDCVSLVFLSHGGLSNQNLELWISNVRAVLELVIKVFDENLDNGNVGFFALRFCCLLLEPFAKFLKFHPARKNGFRDFVDELLGPLLYLVGSLHLHFDGSNSSWKGKLLPVAEEVLSQGVFHPVHIEGFLSLRSTEKYSASCEDKVKDSKTVNKSYHRHFFDKLGRIMSSKKSELSGLGELFHLLVDRVKKQKVASELSEEPEMAEKTDGLMQIYAHSYKLLHPSSNALPENSYVASNLTSEKRKSLFDFFVQIIEPLFFEMESYLQIKLEIGPLLLDAHRTIKSINCLLARFSLEKLYIKTEDISEGAFLNFLKKVYKTVISFSNNVLCLSIDDTDSGTQETLILLAKELVVSLQYLLDIEYEVIENDLTSLWLMVLSYLALGHSLKDAPNQCSLSPQILGFGCQLVKLYSELRQVESIILALCKAMRLIIVSENNGGNEQSNGCFGSCTTSLPYKVFADSVEMLLCAQEFKLAIQNGIKSIPEGQASGCIRQLSEDLSESIDWMKSCSLVADTKELQESNTKECRMHCFDLVTELFGTGFSELYALVLDSLSVTTGNSSLIGKSLKDLMAVIQPSMSVLVGLQPDSVNEFLHFVTGKPYDMSPDCTKHSMQNFGGYIHWVFVFFFRLYMSCRSLFRQAIALMPPDTSRKMSAVMQDSFTAYSGSDSMERADWTDDGYFSWILQSSASLLAVIRSVSDNCLQHSNANCCPLLYVLHAMALQRLVDLNRQIKSLEYIQKSIDGIMKVKLLDDSRSSDYRKRSRKWGRRLSGLKEEAEGLAEYIMSHISLLDNDRISVNNTDDAAFSATYGQALGESSEWDLGVCSVNQESLPTAIWWIVCQNIDIWSIHASKKMLKMFLSHVIRTSLPFLTRSFAVKENKQACETGYPNKINMHQISSELLTNSILYEHSFVCRHLVSGCCHLLKNSVLSLFGDFSIMDVDLNSFPNWQEVLSAIGSLPKAVSGSKLMTCDYLSEGKSRSHSSVKMAADIFMDSTAMKFRACQSLLDFLCWLPKWYMHSRSFSLSVTYLLNLERYIISSLLECRDAMSLHYRYELLRLLLSCRKALRYVVVAFSEEKTVTHSSVIPVLSEDLFSVLWLFKSLFVVVGLQETFSKDYSDEIREMIFSLMDHTSYLFLALSKHDCACVIHSIIAAEPHDEQTNSEIVQELSTLNESDSPLDFLENDKAWKNILLVAESLKEQTRDSLTSLKDVPLKEIVRKGIGLVSLNRLSSIVSWISGLLWGLVSALNNRNAISSDKLELLRSNFGPSSRIGLCISVYVDYIGLILHSLSVEDGHQAGSSFDFQNVQTSNQSGWLGSHEISNKGFPQTGASGDAKNQKSAAVKKCLTASTGDNNVCNGSTQRGSFKLEATVASVLTKPNTYECESLSDDFLQSLLIGDHPEAAILIRQLFVASSALLRLNLQTNCTSALSSLVPSFIGIARVLLLQLANVSEVPQSFSIVWLDGVLKYLQELGSHFPSKIDSTSAGNVYARLIELHLIALGKFITLQEKEATLASHETESSSKILFSSEGSSESSLSLMLLLDEFKARLRMSFNALISKSMELHLLPAIQVIERTLVGEQEGCKIIYEINTTCADGGKVSSTVAASIDCLDILLEYISGCQQSSVVKGHIQKSVAALFNIILHLQSLSIFYRIPTGSAHNGPDPGAVILMCVEVLTRVSRKRGLQMTSCHVAQSLHLPGALFQDFYQLKISKGPPLSNTFSDNQDFNPVAGMHFHVDKKFSVGLFAACCRLLCTTVKHQKRETEKCIALLQDSASVLLHCLETVDDDLRVSKGYFSWGVQEGVECACALRRIYEELRQHKDDFGQHCFKFLSDYISIYSGYGPLKTGIRREIDEALRPGVYALIDACSVDDLQYLHSVFGEGPCRNTLAVLQHDYKLNFQYAGKV